MKNNKKGFTIVELVIVIAVIAILAAVLIPTFSGVIGKANQSAAQQTATNALKAGLLMTNTASLPADTFILVDSDKQTNSKPDYGYIYDGSVLGDPQNLYKDNAFQTSSFIKAAANTILVSDKMITPATEAVGTQGEDGYVAAKPASLDALLVSMLKAAFNAADTDTVAFETVDDKTVIRVTHGGETKDFAYFTSVDMPSNVVIFVPMG